MTASAPVVNRLRRWRSPRLLILPSRSLPPLELCLGTRPIQAEKSLPDRNIFGSATLATRAVANAGPTPGISSSRRLSSLDRCQALIIRSNCRIRAFSIRNWAPRAATPARATSGNRLSFVSAATPSNCSTPWRPPCESHLRSSQTNRVCKKRLLDYSELPGFADLGAVTVSVACQANEFAKISSRLVVVTYRFSRLSGSVETAQPLRRTIHRGFVFDQRCGRVALFQQKIGEQLAHWIQPIFHRHVFLAVVFAVRCGAHQRHSFCPATLCVREPTLCGENL